MKYAVCNELFGKLTFEALCQISTEHGFQGIEIAPFTLCEDVQQIDSVRIREIRQILRQTDLQFAGFHWLLVSPPGLHITTPDAAVRERSWNYLKRLLDLAGELGGGDLVLGSPQQRHVTGIPLEQGRAYLREGLANIAPYAVARNSTVLLEALPARHTNLINTLAEVKTMLTDINHPGVQGMFDFNNCGDESLPWDVLIETYFDMIRRVHLSENGDYPGSGTADFRPAFQKLLHNGYTGWVSLEIFHIPEDPRMVLSRTWQFLQTMET